MKSLILLVLLLILGHPEEIRDKNLDTCLIVEEQVLSNPQYDVDMSIIMMIESSGNRLATNKGLPHTINDDSRGLYQITPPCLKSYNKATKSNIHFDDLYDSLTNSNIAHWYMFEEIPRLLNAYHKPITLENKIICYNAGIGYLIKNKKIPDTTLKYIKKYNKLSNSK